MKPAFATILGWTLFTISSLIVCAALFLGFLLGGPMMFASETGGRLPYELLLISALGAAVAICGHKKDNKNCRERTTHAAFQTREPPTE